MLADKVRKRSEQTLKITKTSVLLDIISTSLYSQHGGKYVHYL